MRFTIEIYATSDSSGPVIHRESVSSISPLGARKQAQRSFAEWEKRGAKSFRLVNVRGETLYKSNE